jgi:hypothetical protein
MIRGSKYRESELPDVPPGRGSQAADGRRCISVIGIDRYRQWSHLDNAVSDACGVLAAFENIGFVPIVAPLLDDAATGEAIRCLPAALTPQLDHDDSLVVFFAGHGCTRTTRFPDGFHIPKGYLIPVDADRDDGREQTWQRVEPWLTTIAELPPRHVLVILDSCHSGIALSRDIVHRGRGVRADGSPVPVDERRSRRVLTSTLDDQQALDGGPIAGHSVFSGYLIEALRGGALLQDSSVATVGAVADYVHHGVLRHSRSRQAPRLGFLEFDDSGELYLSLRPSHKVPRAERPSLSETPQPTAVRHVRSDTTKLAGRTERPSPSEIPQPTVVRHVRSDTTKLADRTEGWILDPALAAALDRQGEERRRGAHVLTIIAGEALPAQTSWGTWAARQGYLTLATQSVGLDAAVVDLLAQTPWLRCVPEARKRLAAAARIDVAAVDASLDARSASERRTWIDDVAGLDLHARVSGWLLSWLRRPVAAIPDPTAAPVQQGELLAIACDLVSPTAVLLFHPTPDERWLERAVVTAAELINYLPAHSVAVTAPAELASRVLRSHRRGAAWTMARQGWLNVDALAQRLPGRARHSTMRRLFEALERDPRTRRRFELDGKVVPDDGPPIDVALVAHGDRIAVELDAWYHFHDPEGYRRDRVQDLRLARAGYFVLRFPTEDVDDRLASTIEHLTVALAGRRAARIPI